ncbi:uncharacterized protein LOC108742618 [Agrilus planipennis]|uniref:Uncharacterized protein LOC108742618 n=2 Tax=Agrilus planipennis TaxID=224129 RepID=A0A7F5RDF0_AGRPL|nr:uncharacterized protein LOC108742618 [Agrilus planipennis]
MAPTLYHSEHSAPSRSVLLTAKELGLKLNLKVLDLANGEQLQPEFLKLNPQHTVPTLVEENGFAIWESHAINSYLVKKYGKNDSLYPKDLKKKAVVDQRLYFDSGTLVQRFSTLIKNLVAGKTKVVPKSDVDSIKEAYSFLETFLRSGDYVTGNQLTVADFQIVTSIFSVSFFVPIQADEFPRISLWIKRMEALPYFKEVNDNGIKLYKDIMKSKLEQLEKEMTITLYFADASPPARSSILTIKALGLKNVTFKRVDLMQREQHKPEFLKLNPQHTVPTLVDEDGFTVWDSHAINTYLASKYDEKSSFYPKDLQKRAIIDQRLHFSCGTLFPRIARTFVGLLFHPEAGISQESIDEIKEAYGFLEKFLEKGKYIAGNELTVADFSLATEVVSIVYCPPSPDEFPKITAWIKRMKELPYFDEVNEKALQILQALVNPKPA